MVNDLNTSGVNLTMFVDDMTNIDVVSNGTLRYLQPIVDYFVSRNEIFIQCGQMQRNARSNFNSI